MAASKRQLMDHYNLSEYQADEVIRMLPIVRRELKKNAIYAQVNSVSRSVLLRA